MNLDPRLERYLLAGAAALLVARPLYPSESAVQGDGLTWVMLWLALAASWALARVAAGGSQRRGRGTVASRNRKSAGQAPPLNGIDNAGQAPPLNGVRFGAFDAAVVLLLGWIAAAAVPAVVYRAARPAVNMTWQWIGLGVAFLVLRQLINTERRARAFAVVMVALAVALSGYGLYQYAVELPATRALYETDPEAALRAAGIEADADSPLRTLFEARLAATEPLATFALTNSLAGYLAPWLVVLVGVLLSGRLDRRTLIGGSLAVLLIAACLWLTHSRSAQLATLLGLATVAAIRYGPAVADDRARRWWVLGSGAVALIVVLLAALAIGRGGLANAAQSFGYRLQYWQSTAAMVADDPWLGIGPGNFQFEYTRYKLPTASEEITDPHNFMMELAATAGLPATVIFIGILALFIQKAAALAAWGGPPIAAGGSQRTEPRAPVDWPIIIGAGIGFLLSIPLGLLSVAPPGLAAVIIGLPLAAVTVWLLLPWIRDGAMPRWLPAAGAGVLMIHLLAAGGISFPGVAMSLWLLIALMLVTDAAQPTSRIAAWTIVAAALLLTITCYFTAAGPVVRARGAQRAADTALDRGDVDRARDLLEQAAAADPLWAEPHRRLAELAFARWWHSGNPAAMRRFERHDTLALQRRPHAAQQWRSSGLTYWRAWERSGLASDAKKAVAALTRAAQLYPTSAAIRAELARAQLAAGDNTSARKNAREALRLDRLTPHADKKLQPKQRHEMRRLLESANALILEKG